MEKEVKCPYCGANMEKGTISGDRCVLKWVPGEYTGIFTQFRRGIKLVKKLEFNYVIVYYCKDCQKMVIDANHKVE